MSADSPPIRVLTAVPLCDGHDSAISTINLELIHQGIEVIYLGYNRSVRDIVRAAVQEDVRGVGISSYNGGHVEFFSAVVAGLRREGAGDIRVFGGGGGTITQRNAVIMHRRGVDRIFFPGTQFGEIVEYVKRSFDRPHRINGMNGRHKESPDCAIARSVSAAERRGHVATRYRTISPPVIGFTGPGGAGKTTLIDELVLRLLQSDSRLRIAILSHDPSIVGNGALLGDRATMVYSQHDRVFMRSMGSRGRAGGLADATAPSLRVLRSIRAHAAVPPFDVILVETVGVGQEAMPFAREQVDRTVLVMSPDSAVVFNFKIAMLDLAGIVVVNKSDLAQAKTAVSEIASRLEMNHRDQRLVMTTAKRHRDGGVDELFKLIWPPVAAKSREQLVLAHE